MILNVVFFLLAIITGIRVNNKKNLDLKKTLPSLVYEPLNKIEMKEIPSNPFFGEKPHYFTPPSDLEQFRVKSNKKIKSILAPDGEHHYIPYPNDPPSTFPSIKARSLFTKSPKDLREVYIPSADPLERENSQKGTKLKIPLSQLEERFRGVYSNAERNNLDITINALENEDVKQWEKQGIKQSKIYNFHQEDGLKTSLLVDTSKKEPIWEKL